MGLNLKGMLSSAIGNMLGGIAGKIMGKSNFNFGTLGTQINELRQKSSEVKYKNFMYRYRVQKIEIVIPNEKDPIRILPDAVENITIIKEFDAAYHPIFQLTTTLPPLVFKKIKENKQDVQFRIKIYKLQLNKSGQLIKKKSFIDDTFTIIMDDDTDFKDENTYHEANKLQGASKTSKNKGVFNRADYTLEYTFYLWKQSDLDAMRSTVNAVYQNCTVSTAIANIFSESNINKILISPLDNDASYSEIRIPPMVLLKLPQYLETVYGLYYSGSCVFLDYRCLYFLSRNGVCDAHEEEEFTRTIFRVPKANKADKARIGTMEDQDNKFYYLYIPPDEIEMNNPSNTNDVINGNSRTIINTADSENTEIQGLGDQSGSGNKRIVSDHYSNDYNKTVMASDVVEMSRQAAITTYDYDEDAFTPNKEFVLMFDDSKFKEKNGFYRLVESKHVLVKSGTKDLEITGIHKFTFKAAIEVQYDENNEEY